MLKYILLLIVSNVIFLNLCGQNKDWKLVKENENIKAYVCKLPDSPIKKVKVETMVESNLSQLVSIIRDAD